MEEDQMRQISMALGNNQSSVASSPSQDPSTALKLAETRRDIETFTLDLCGMAKVKVNDITETVRITKPKITYDLAKEIMATLFIQINRITGRTTYEEEDINLYNQIKSETFSDFLASKGMQHLISDNVWNVVVSLCKRDQIVKNSEGEDVVVSRWFKIYGIDFDYRKDQFTSDLLNLIKINYDLQNESFGQDIMLRELLWSMMSFVHGGMNRSLNSLTLHHERDVYKETFVNNSNMMKTGSQSAIDRLKSGLTKFF